jgi:hypothetical protein
MPVRARDACNREGGRARMMQGASITRRRRRNMPQYAVLIYANDSAHAVDARPEDLADADRHAEELTASGRLRVAYALTPRDLAVSVRATGVTDGPFIDSKEVVAGFYILEAADLDEAVRSAERNPAVLAGGGVEVRLVHSGGVVGGE